MTRAARLAAIREHPSHANCADDNCDVFWLLSQLALAEKVVEAVRREACDCLTFKTCFEAVAHAKAVGDRIPAMCQRCAAIQAHDAAAGGD